MYGNGGTEEELGNIAWSIYLGQQQKGSLRFNKLGPPSFLSDLQCCLSLTIIAIQFCLSIPPISTPSAPHPLLTPGPGSGPDLHIQGQKSLCVSVAYLIRLGSFGLLASLFYPCYPLSSYPHPIFSEFFSSQPLSTTPTATPHLA